MPPVYGQGRGSTVAYTHFGGFGKRKHFGHEKFLSSRTVTGWWSYERISPNTENGFLVKIVAWRCPLGEFRPLWERKQSSRLEEEGGYLLIFDCFSLLPPPNRDVGAYAGGGDGFIKHCGEKSVQDFVYNFLRLKFEIPHEGDTLFVRYFTRFMKPRFRSDCLDTQD